MVARLAAAGCIAADEEAGVLLEAGAGDPSALEAMLARRETGEPLEWIVGWAPFCGLRIGVEPGVYVPRAQTEVLAYRAIELLGNDGIAIDLATGCGAVAVALAHARPGATVVATEIDPVAARCARANGVQVSEGDLDSGLPAALMGLVDVMTANVPYVPTGAIALLPRDVRTYEPRLALDGGPDGLTFVRRVLDLAPRWLRPGGTLVIEIGPDQASEFPEPDFAHLSDDDGDTRAIAWTLHPFR